MATTDESFLSDAKRRVVVEITVARPAAEVWAELTEDGPMSSYCRAISSITWTSKRPFGPGTTRTTRVLGGLIRVDERYPVWEEGRRKVFVGVRTTPPTLRRLSEEYVVEPVDDTSCRFRWTAAWEPTLLGRPILPIGHAVFASIARDIRRHFESY